MMVFFFIRMSVAYGSGGLGVIMYAVGSAMGQIIMMMLLSMAPMLK